MDDAPLPLSATGTPNVVSAPMQSMYQQDAIALRMLLYATWALRRPNRISFVQNVTW